MATREDFAQDDWQLIVASPALVGLAVSAASPSGTIGMTKEVLAVGAAAAGLAEDAAGNRLIQDLVEDVRSGATEEVRPQDVSSLDEARVWAVGELGRLREVLDRSGAGSDGDELRQWLVEVARRVAEAAREGSFLGLGGDRVSDAEEAAIAEIRDALGV
jgi:hypothetical protein